MSSHFQSSHFASTHFESSHFGRTAIIVPPVVPPFTPEPVHPPGAGEDAEARRTRILLEDEMIFHVIMAFLDMKDR
jgi:hypothetical protein